MKFSEDYNERKKQVLSIIDNIKDICLEFDDNGIIYAVPDKDIMISIISNIIYNFGYILKYKDFLKSITNNNVHSLDDIFSVSININNSCLEKSGQLFNDWFVDTCLHIENYMKSLGFKIKIKILFKTGGLIGIYNSVLGNKNQDPGLENFKNISKYQGIVIKLGFYI